MTDNRDHLSDVLAIIPARGGSKGVPRKNILPLAGHPLVAHTIRQALQSIYITRLVVSTDDAEIGAVAQQYGAEVVWRPAALSVDTASSESALLHVLSQLASTENYQPDAVVFLQATAPLMTAADIDGTVAKLLAHNADSALVVVPYHGFLWQEQDDGTAVGVNHDSRVRLRRQELPPEYVEAGSVYVMRAEGFVAARHRFFGKTVLYVQEAQYHLDIDSPIDFQIAETLLRYRQESQRLALLPDPVAALVLDFDGVFTDNRVLVAEDGREAVLSHRGDGMGISRMKKLGIPVIVLSTETNPVVQARCNKLKIPYEQGLADKLAVLKAWLMREQIDRAHVVYVGNDVNDIACLQHVGCGVVVQDAHPATLPYAQIILEANGGYGAIREITDLIERQRGDFANA